MSKSTHRGAWPAGWVLGFALVGAGCSPGPGPAGGADRPAARITLATTTSTDNSGLLEVILPPFEQARGVRVDVIATGSGKALKLAERGDVDLVWVHAPAAEQAFMDAGLGVNRRVVMYNDFVILGPADDPAGVAQARTVVSVLRSIAGAEAPFVSRGDDSGTHKRERALWQEVGIEPARASRVAGSWYVEAGQGMGATLTMAEEKQAYVLCDRGTYLAFKDRLDLVLLYENPTELKNIYHVIAVNPKRHPQVHYAEALALIDWLTSPEGQAIIGNFRKEGQVLFHPCARAEDGSQSPERGEAQ